MRECELLCKESILEVIRTSIPVEKILRSYIDETVDEEVVHEISEKEIEKEMEVKPEEITELFFTTTQPTDGFNPVLPRLTFAILKANFKKLLWFIFI